MEFIENEELAQVEGGWCPLKWISPIVIPIISINKPIISSCIMRIRNPDDLNVSSSGC